MRGGSPIDNFNFLSKYKLIITILMLFLCIGTVGAAITQYTLTDGIYTVVIFNGTGSTTWTAPSYVSTIEYLVVAGGGGGGAFNWTGSLSGGGGGAGGMLNASGYTLNPSSTYNIIVGSGGSGGYTIPSTNGQDSAFGNATVNISAVGGGRGAGTFISNSVTYLPGDGGSGGGNASNASTTPIGGSGIAGQGNWGGYGYYPQQYASGGGGGANNTGGNGSGSNGGAGGDGRQSNITGILTYYAGGGGGGMTHWGSGYVGTGGLGGGGNGSDFGADYFGWTRQYNFSENFTGIGDPITKGVDGTGGGGGGGADSTIGGDGGSGVVILKYVTPPVAIFSTNENSGFNGYITYSVVFTDSSTGNPTSWNWSFGDGSYVNGSNSTIHTYTVAGNYSVNLTVANSGGFNISPGQYWLNFSNPVSPPVADFSGTPTNGTPPLSVSFTDSSVFATGWAWFFDDETYNQSWNQVNSSSGWRARWQHSVVSVRDGTIILTGGTNGTRMNDTWRSVDYGKTWTLMNASSGWSARSNHLMVLMPDYSIVLMGGYDGSSKNDTWRSTNNGLTWTLMNASSGWLGRNGFSGIALQDSSNSIVIMGGTNGTLMNDTWQSTNYGATWTLMSSNPGWLARSDFRSVVMQDGSIVLMSGQGTPAPVYYDDVWRSTDKGATWVQQTSNAAWTGRAGSASVRMPDESIVFMGGYDMNAPTVGNDTWRSKDYGVSWTLLNLSESWSIRSGFSGVVMPNCSIMIFGGAETPAGGPYLNDSWIFNPIGSTLQNPSHIFQNSGYYDISMRAYNVNGYNTTVRLSYIYLYGPASEFNITPNPASLGSTITFVDMSTNGATTWNWSFGDGNTSTNRNTTYTYSAIGEYIVRLNVTNAYGTSNTSHNVTIIPSTPIANFSIDHNIGANPLTVIFTDTSTGSGVTNWYWNFGDGTNSTTSDNATHQYTSLGTYYAQLTVTSSVGTNISQPQAIYVVNSAVPITDFVGNPTSGSAPLSVQFTDLSSALSGVNAWNWSFGDGNYSNLQNPVYIYPANGQYTVSLTSTSGAFSNFSVKIAYISLGISPNTVSADFTATPLYAASYPQVVQFTDTSVCSPLCNSWAWDLNGDGAVDSIAKNPSYNYTYPGNYSPKLIVSNGLNTGTRIRNQYIIIGPIFVAPTITQPREPWMPGYHDNDTMFAFRGNTQVDPQNSTYLKYWLQNFTATGNFSVYGFAIGMMAPIMHVFGFWIFLIIWGLYLFAVWIRSQDVTLPLIIGILTMGTFGLLFPKESLPVIIIMFVICGGIIITKLMKDSI